MNEIAESTVQEIIRLHEEIGGHMKMCFEKCLRVGEILVEAKEGLKHGEFIPWIKANLPFTDRTAQNYMRIYKERDRLKTENVSGLSGAYRLLKKPAPVPKTDGSKKWWNEATAEEMGAAIKAINEDIGDPEESLDPDVEWFFKSFEEMDPQSDEDLAIARKLEIGKFYCCLKNSAWHKGMASLPLSLQNFMQQDDIIPTEEPYKICKGWCCMPQDHDGEKE